MQELIDACRELETNSPRQDVVLSKATKLKINPIPKRISIQEGLPELPILGEKGLANKKAEESESINARSIQRPEKTWD